MIQRGRKSNSSLAIVRSSPIEAMRRPDPPSELSKEQAEEWRKVTESMAADWFPDSTHAVLAAYCRHVVQARRLSDMIQEYEAKASKTDNENPFSLKYYDSLLRMLSRETLTMSALATRMRLTQQSSYDGKRRKSANTTSRPWDRNEEA